MHSMSTNFILLYKNEVLVIACLVAIVLGALAAYYYTPPSDVTTSNNPILKVTLALAGGFCAFFWVLDQHGSVVTLHPVWVFGVTFISPIAMQLVVPVLLEKWQNLLAKLFD